MFLMVWLHTRKKGSRSARATVTKSLIRATIAFFTNVDADTEPFFRL
jgi:hypothetical protein